MDYSRHIRRRLVTIGVAREDADRVARWYCHQLAAQGLESAVAYFKRVGDTILNYLYNTPERPAWVATKHRFPTCLYFLKKYPEQVLLRVAKIARAVRLEDVTDAQVAKVVNGAISPYNGDPDGLTRLSSLIQRGVTATRLPRSTPQPSSPPLVGKRYQRVVSLSGVTPLTDAPPVKESLEIAIRVPALYNLPYWKEPFAPIHPNYLEDVFERYLGPEDHPVGEIHAAQEGGAKLRMYAAPYTIVQCLLYPIHYWMDRLRSRLVTDCTYNQLEGAVWAQSKLLDDQTVYSVDLSTATCRFPLSVQLETVRSLGLHESFVSAIEWASRGTWLVGDELQPRFPATINWKVGQPLGIAPSMSMFSLCHNLLLAGCCDQLGLPIDSFRVLGDDVVLVNASLYNLYTEVLTLAGIPISWHKCHISKYFAEFAGASISRSTILRPGQWREPEVNNHLDLAKDLRTPLYGEVSQKWTDAQKLYLFMDGTYDPPAEEWSRYLRLSTMAKRILTLDPPDPVNGTVFWETGIRRHIRMELGNKPWFLPYDRDWVSIIYSGLPQCDGIRYWKHMSSVLTHHDPDQVLIEAFTGIWNSYVSGELSTLEFHSCVDQIESNIRGLYWYQPSTKKGGGHWHRKLVNLLVTA